MASTVTAHLIFFCTLELMAPDLLPGFPALPAFATANLVIAVHADLGFNVEKGPRGETIVCEVTPGGEAESLKLQVGDRILEVVEPRDSSGKYDDVKSALELSTRPMKLRVTWLGEAGPYRDDPRCYGYTTLVDDDGTFAPYTILTKTLKQGESAPVIRPQKRGMKKGFKPETRDCGCSTIGPHKSSCSLSSEAKRVRGGPGAGPIPGA